LHRFWQVHGHFTDGRSLLERALARSKGIGVRLSAEAYYIAGLLAWFQGDYQQADLIEIEGSGYVREQLANAMPQLISL
jgi:hypothetical protein